MAEDLEHPAVKRLLAYFNAMNDWGSRAQLQSDAIDWERTTTEEVNQLRDSWREQLTGIYSEYCEVGVDAKRLRDSGVSFNRGRQFYEEVTAVNHKGDKIIIETQQTEAARWRYCYELVLVGDIWRIRNNRKQSSDKDRRWKTDLL